MNERLRELVRQAGLDDSDFPIEDWDNVPLAKFAELIVRECLKEIKDMIVDESERLYPNNKQTTECVNDRLLDAYDNIKEHFGVEE